MVKSLRFDFVADGSEFKVRDRSSGKVWSGGSFEEAWDKALRSMHGDDGDHTE